MGIALFSLIIAALKLTLALSPLLVIVAIFAMNKNMNQRTKGGAAHGNRVGFVDSDDEDETKQD